jgi:hypothetical protein
MKKILSEELTRIKSLMGLKILSEQDLPKGVGTISNALVNSMEKYIPQISSQAVSKDVVGISRNLALNLVRAVANAEGKTVNSFGKKIKRVGGALGTKESDILVGDKFYPNAIDANKVLDAFKRLPDTEKAAIIIKNMDALVGLKIITPTEAADALKQGEDLDYQWTLWYATNGGIEPKIGSKIYKVSDDKKTEYLNKSFEDFMKMIGIPKSLQYALKTHVGGDPRINGTNISINPNFKKADSSSLESAAQLSSPFKNPDIYEALFRLSENFSNIQNNPKRIYDKLMTTNDPALAEVKKWLAIPENKDQFVSFMSSIPNIETQQKEGLDFLMREGVIEPEKMGYFQKLTMWCTRNKVVYPKEHNETFLWGLKKVRIEGEGEPFTRDEVTFFCRWFQGFLFLNTMTRIIGVLGLGGLTWIVQYGLGGKAIVDVTKDIFSNIQGCAKDNEIEQFLNGEVKITEGYDYSEEDTKKMIQFIKDNNLYFKKEVSFCQTEDTRGMFGGGEAPKPIPQLYIMMPQRALDGSFDMNSTQKKYVYFKADRTVKLMDRSDQTLKDKADAEYDNLQKKFKDQVEKLKQEYEKKFGKPPIKDQEIPATNTNGGNSGSGSGDGSNNDDIPY